MQLFDVVKLPPIRRQFARIDLPSIAFVENKAAHSASGTMPFSASAASAKPLMVVLHDQRLFVFNYGTVNLI